MDQVVQILGSLLILTAFIASQLGRMSVTSLTFLALNLVGSAILAVLALIGGQWGFLLLEGCWAAVSGRGFVLGLSSRPERHPG